MKCPLLSTVCPLGVAVSFVLALPVVGVAQLSAPKPLATTSLTEDYQLEVYFAHELPFGGPGPEFAFMLADEQFLDKVTGDVAFGPWEDQRVRGLSQKYLLGLLVRNKDGELVAANCSSVSAYRALFSDGTMTAYWPTTARDSPIQELIGGAGWDYDLTPLVVEGPKDSRVIGQLEGAVLLTPQWSVQFQIELPIPSTGVQVFQDNTLIYVDPPQKTVQGSVYQFLVAQFVPQQPDAGQARRGKRQAMNVSDSILGFNTLMRGFTASGESVQPVAQEQSSVNERQRKVFVREMLEGLRKKPDPPEGYEQVIAFFRDPQTHLSLHKFAFGAAEDLQQLELTISRQTGLPKLLPFRLKDIPLRPGPSVESINQFVKGLDVEVSVNQRSAPEFRTWQDASGRFQVEAKFVDAEDDSVTIEKRNGQRVSVPLSKLSAGDREYVRELNPN